MARFISMIPTYRWFVILLVSIPFTNAVAHGKAPLTGDPVDCVNPLSGTNGDGNFSRGNTLAALVAPFGMTTWAPQTDANSGPFYQLKHDRFEGIRATHQPSIWVRDYGDFLVTPVVGAWRGSVRDRASAFSHERETARPYYYSVDLDRYDTQMELTPTERCALIRLAFPETKEASVVFAGEGEVDSTYDSTKSRIRGKATHVTSGAPGGFAMYFVVEFDRPFESVDVVRDQKTATAAVHLAPPIQGSPALLRIGTSFISYEQAELNLRNELPEWDFEKSMARARSVWATELSKVDIEGATAEQKSTFYTALYRTLQFPRMFHEPDASGKLRHYSPYDNGKIHDGPLYTDYGLWDTYRAAVPLFVLYYPEHAESILEGWLNAYREGGWLPTWPSPGNRPCMIGSHGDAMFADAWGKGLRLFNLDDAYAATRKDAFENNPGSWAGRDHLDDYIELGYVPIDKRKEGASACTLEYAYSDYCVSRLAKATGHEEDYQKLIARAQNYRNIWDVSTGLMRGKLSNGKWQEPFDPLSWGGPWVEGNAYQWVWSVQHDPYGLIELLGGHEAAAKKLDTLLSMPSTTVVGSYGRVIHEMSEVEAAKMGQYAHINEPDHHVLYFYDYVRQPWKGQFAIRRVMDELYDVDGMVGDEDTGQMSAWYVFNAAGIYPFCPGSPYYVIGSPLFKETVLHLKDGKTFKVRTENNSTENRYIQSARFNGKPFTKTWLAHNTIASGGVLEFEMGAEPNEQWGAAADDAPPNDFP